MRLTSYKLCLDEDKINYLVKENSKNYPKVDAVNSPIDVYNIMKDVYELDTYAEEYVYMLALNTKNKVIGCFLLTKGTVNKSLISIREIFIRASLIGAVSFVLVHNHPSGDSKPSNDDIIISNRVNEASKIMDINFFDFIIIGDYFYSFKEQDLL